MAEPKHTYGELRQAAKVALQQGNMPLAQEIADRIKQGKYKETQSDIVSGALGAAQSATMGLGDEVGAVVRAATEPVLDPFFSGVGEMFSPGHYTGDDDLGPLERFSRGYQMREKEFFPEFHEKPVLDQLGSYAGDFMKRYRTYRDSARSQLETAQREDPLAYMGGELAGGLLQGGSGVAKGIANAPRTLSAGMKAGAKTGGAYGGMYGFGTSEGDPLAAMLSEEGAMDPASAEVMEVFGDTLRGATTGVLTGGMLPAIGAGLRNTAQFLTRSGTKDVRLNEAGRRQIAEAIEADLEMKHLTPQQAQDLIDSTPGMTLADLGPNVQMLTEKLTETGTRGGEVLRDMLQSRVAGQYDRIVPTMSKALGLKGEPSRFHHHVQKLLDTAEDAAKPLYDQAYQKGIRLTPEMANILKNTAVGKIGRKRATEYAAEALEDIGSPLKRADLTEGVIIPTKHMDYMLRAMDDHVDGLFMSKKGKKGLAFQARNRRDEFREALYKANEPFRQAREAWAGPAASNRALKAGKDVFKKDPEITAAEMGRLGEGERLYYRIGVMKAVEDRLKRKFDYQDIVNDLKSRQSTREALEAAFGNTQNFNEFMDLLGREAMMQETVKRALGNSATTRKLIQQSSDFGEQLAALGGYGVSLSMGGWVPPSIGGYLAKRGYQAFDPQRAANEAYKQVAAGQAQRLMGQDLVGAMQAQTLGGLLDTGVPISSGFPAGAAATTGILNPNVEYGN